VVRPPPRVQLSRSRIDPNNPSLTTIERRLAYHIGPIAGYALHGALQSAQSAEELCALLGEKVPGGQQRTVFMREVMGVLNASGTLWSTQRDGASCSTGQDTARLAVLTRALTEVMGPIASRLIERARKQAGSVEQTEALCADLISNKDARERFRRLLAGSASGDQSAVSRHLSRESSERQRPAPP